MQRYKNIQRTIATERPEEDSGSQSCEQVPGGGCGGGGESDSDTESSQLSLGMRGRVPRLLGWHPVTVWQSVWVLCSMVLWPRRKSNGMDGGQDRGERGKAQQSKTDRSFPPRTKEKMGSHKENTSTMAWSLKTRNRWSLGTQSWVCYDICASRQFFQCLNHF